MLTLNGCSDRLSVDPGESIRFFVSGEEKSYYARIVWVYPGDTHPDSPGPRYDHVPSDIGEFAVRDSDIGSAWLFTELCDHVG